MANLIDTIRDIAEKRIAYERTVNEIEAMSHEVAIDLDIFREDARKIARKAVYGQ